MKDVISVIVTTYNQEKTISRTLDSILMQECRWPIEVVIGEDCSTDKTGDICKQYAVRYPKQIRLFSNTKNKGFIENYFDCLLACEGKYIADCAGDDFWTDGHKLERELEVMEAHPEVTIVHTDWKYYDERQQLTYPSGDQPYNKPITDGKELIVPILCQTERPVIHLCTSLYRTSSIREAYFQYTALFRSSDLGCEDLPICALLAHKGQVAYIDTPTLNYSRGEATVSRNQDEHKQFMFVWKTTRQSANIAKALDINQEKMYSFYQAKHFALVMHAFRAHAPEMIEPIEKLEKELTLVPTTKARFVKWLMQSDSRWNLALRFRKLLKGKD